MQNTKGRGSALVTALFIVALVAIAATAMSLRLQADLYRTRLVLTQEQLQLAAQAVRFWGLAQLKNKNTVFYKASDQGQVAKFPKNAEHLIPNIQITGALYDLQSVFNLNNLSDPSALPLYTNLLKNTFPQIEGIEVNHRVHALQDWLSPYDLSKGKDSLTPYYLAQSPPYWPHHGPLQSSSELRLIKGYTAAYYLKLRPLVTALPEKTPLNINTASKQILLSLNKNRNENKLALILAARGEQGIRSTKKLADLLRNINMPLNQITTQSQYFLAVAHARSSTFDLRVYSLLRRNMNRHGELQAELVRECFNVF